MSKDNAEFVGLLLALTTIGLIVLVDRWRNRNAVTVTGLPRALWQRIRAGQGHCQPPDSAPDSGIDSDRPRTVALLKVPRYVDIRAELGEDPEDIQIDASELAEEQRLWIRSRLALGWSSTEIVRGGMAEYGTSESTMWRRLKEVTRG